MKGAITDPCANTSSPPRRKTRIIIGKSHIFLVVLAKSNSSLKSSKLYTPTNKIYAKFMDNYNSFIFRKYYNYENEVAN